MRCDQLTRVASAFAAGLTPGELSQGASTSTWLTTDAPIQSWPDNARLTSPGGTAFSSRAAIKPPSVWVCSPRHPHSRFARLSPLSPFGCEQVRKGLLPHNHHTAQCRTIPHQAAQCRPRATCCPRLTVVRVHAARPHLLCGRPPNTPLFRHSLFRTSQLRRSRRLEES